jgi:hypothetical protein
MVENMLKIKMFGVQENPKMEPWSDEWRALRKASRGKYKEGQKLAGREDRQEASTQSSVESVKWEREAKGRGEC